MNKKRPPHFIDYNYNMSRELTPERRANAQSVLQEIGRITKGKKIIFVYAKEYKGERCAT